MSYVIQNFYKPTKTFSPSVNYILLDKCKNLFKLYTFFKFFEIYFRLPIALKFSIAFYDLFNNFLYFDKPFIFFFSLFKFNTLPHQTSKFQKSLYIFSLQNLNNLLNNKTISSLSLRCKNTYIYNSYFFSDFVIFFSIQKFFYKPLFLYLIFILPQMWPLVSENFLFNLLLIRIIPIFKFLYFINKKTFKIQRF